MATKLIPSGCYRGKINQIIPRQSFGDNCNGRSHLKLYELCRISGLHEDDYDLQIELLSAVFINHGSFVYSDGEKTQNICGKAANQRLHF